MQILISIHRPLSIQGKDALWLKHSTKNQETQDKSKALVPLPFRTGKGEPAHPSYILEAIIGLLFISILRAPAARFQPSLWGLFPLTQSGSVLTQTHRCHVQRKWGNENDWGERVTSNRRRKALPKTDPMPVARVSFQRVTSTLHKATPSPASPPASPWSVCLSSWNRSLVDTTLLKEGKLESCT